MNYNFHTNTKKILSDLHTPVSTYLKVRDAFPQSALLESSDFHANENVTSYIGLEPIASVDVNRGLCTMKLPDGNKEIRPLSASFTISDALSSFLRKINVKGEQSDACGLFGYTTFNCVKYTENIPVRESRDERSDAPDMLYILYRYMLIFDHFKNEITIVELLGDGEESRLSRVEMLMNVRNFALYNFFLEDKEYSTITDEEFKADVRRGVQHCLKGDVFQIVLSRRFVQRFSGDDFKVYRALRSINPSPYLFYFDFGGYRIFGSSPETHCKIKGSRISIDPIAGTTRRTGNYKEDMKAMEFLMNDPKENTEHVMLVELAGDDLSRNAHDVKVDFYKEPQFYSHVIHLVSRVSGMLDEGTDPIKAFFDTFPAGTVSGAPKVPAMQLIAEIEKHNRGAYGGCIGFIGLNGDLNQAITIRTFVSRNNELWYQAGAGIVTQSNDEYELQEVNSKLHALKKAIDKASSLVNV
ncbi:MAG TPA: anthranilate synthase component I family protein [Dysgonamonadaceae bacterium]|nr:anthranilate synthase component I family protein [Dysgonamonadaceae bacterium]